MKENIIILLIIVLIVIVVSGFVYFNYVNDKNISATDIKTELVDLNNNVVKCINQVKDDHIKNIQEFKEIYYLNNQPITRIANHYTDNEDNDNSDMCCNDHNNSDASDNKEHFSGYMSESTYPIDHSSTNCENTHSVDPKEEFFNNIIKNNGINMIYMGTGVNILDIPIDEQYDYSKSGIAYTYNPILSNSCPNNNNDNYDDNNIVSYTNYDNINISDTNHDSDNINDDVVVVSSDNINDDVVVASSDNINDDVVASGDNINDDDVASGDNGDNTIMKTFDNNIDVDIVLSENEYLTNTDFTESLKSESAESLKSTISVKTAPYTTVIKSGFKKLDHITCYTLKEIKDMAKRYKIPITIVDNGIRRACKKEELYIKVKECVDKN